VSTTHFGGLPRGLTLFLDLDGVMFDFDGYFEKLFGLPCSLLPDKEMWRLIESHGAFFRTMPLCEGAMHFYRCVLPLHPMFLTACPGSRFADIAAQKRGAVRHHFGDKAPMVPTPGGEAKVHYMHARGDILVDDFGRNCDRWREEGGFAIHHNGDFTSTMLQLSEYLWPNPLASATSRAPNVAPKTTSPDTTTATRTASELGAATVNLPEEKPFRLTVEPRFAACPR